MKTENKQLFINHNSFFAAVSIMEPKDIPDFIKMYELWSSLSYNLSLISSNNLDVPDFSVLFYCYLFDCWRIDNIESFNNSFQCFNPKTSKFIQIISINEKIDVNSFNYESNSDDTYFMDFYFWGNYDGSFKIYLIEDILEFVSKFNIYDFL